MAPLDIPLWWMLFCSTQYSEVICEDGQVHGGEDDNTVVGISRIMMTIVTHMRGMMVLTLSNKARVYATSS